MNAFGLAPLLIIIPFMGFLFNALVGRRFVDSDRTIGERWTGWIASIAALSAFGIAVLLAFSLASHETEAEIVQILDWIVIPAATTGYTRINCRRFEEWTDLDGLG